MSFEYSGQLTCTHSNSHSPDTAASAEGVCSFGGVFSWRRLHAER